MSQLVFKDGFDYSFSPDKCDDCDGNCCIGESGYIWINNNEIIKLANLLSLTVDQVKNKYIFKVGYKYSLKEIQITQNNYICCFFDLEKKQCGIYEARPSQCRTFPFWEHFKTNKQEVFDECPAVKNI